MRHYEVMVIVDAGLEDDAIRATLDRAEQTLTGAGATVNKVDRWGKRRFAYEVHHRTEGYYAVMDIAAEPAAVAQLDRMLRLTDEVIRHKVVRLPDEAVVATVVPPGAGPREAPDANENGAN